MEDKMSTLKECMDIALQRGFTLELRVSEGELQVIETGQKYRPEEVKIVNFYRYEGESAPEDESILYLLETKDLHKGMLIDAYGPYADTEIAAFIKKVQEIRIIVTD